MTQNEIVWHHLKKKKSITPLQALKLYGIMRLGARIHELKTYVSIKREMVNGHNRFGAKTRYAKYYI